MKKYSYIATAALLAAVMVVGAGCGKKNAQETTAAPTTAAQETTQAPTREAETETEPEETEDSQENKQYHILQGTIARVSEDGSEFTLQADDGKSYDLKTRDVRDVETELEADAQIAIAYIGEESDTLSGATLVLALPEQEEWEILTEKGTTVANAMSTFTIQTEDGQEIGFMKDNCPMEDGALTGDSGDKVEVIYVNSQGMNLPLEIKDAD